MTRERQYCAMGRRLRRWVGGGVDSKSPLSREAHWVPVASVTISQPSLPHKVVVWEKKKQPQGAEDKLHCLDHLGGKFGIETEAVK